MLIRFNNTITEVDTVEFINKIVAGDYRTNIKLEADSEAALNYAINKDYLKITNIRSRKVNSTNMYDPTSKYVAVFDAQEKINVKGLCFKRNNEEVYFLECEEEVSEVILNRLLSINYIDLRDVIKI